MKKHILATGLTLSAALLSLDAAATEAPLLLTLSLQLSKTDYTDASSPYKSRAATATATLSKAINERTVVGGVVAYGQSDIDAKVQRGNGDTDLYSAAGFVAYRLPLALTADLSIGYGKVSLDNAYTPGATRISYNADTDFWTASAGLTLNIPVITRHLHGSFGLRYNYIDADRNAYTDSSGTRQSGDSRDKGYATAVAGLRWLRNDWQPYVYLRQNLTRHDFANSDRNYLNYSVGLSRPLANKAALALSYDSTAGKAHTHDKGLTLSYSLPF